MKIRKAVGATIALALALAGVAVGTALPASAHTGDLSVTAVCNTTTGQYDLTAKLAIAATTEASNTLWKVGTSTFEHTPVAADAAFAGTAIHSATNPSTITLGTFHLPGNTTGKGPWVYAQTRFEGDNFFVGSDGQLLTNLAGTCVAPVVPPTITVPTLTPVPPTCLADGTLSFLNNPAAQNPNGYEFPGQGFRVYISPAFAGPGTYTATFQKVGAGFDPAYPNGTKVTGQTTQTLVVLPKLDHNDPACYTPPTAVCTPATVNASLWTTEDGAPTFERNADGSVSGATFKTVVANDKVNYFSTPNSQPLNGTTGSYTVTGAGGPLPAWDVETYLSAAIPFSTTVYEPANNGFPVAGDGTPHTYTIDATSLVWNTRITSGPGSQAQPITFHALQLLFHDAHTLRAGLGQGKNNAAVAPATEDKNIVSAFSFDCANTDFTAPAIIIPPAVVTHTPVTTQECSTTTATTVDTISTTTYSLNAARDGVVANAPVITTNTTTRALTDAEIALCPTVVLVPPTQTGPTCTAGSTYTVYPTNEGAKYSLRDINDANSRPVAGTFNLAAGETVTITEHSTAGYLPVSQTWTLTGADKLALGSAACPIPVVTGNPGLDKVLAYTGTNPGPFISLAVLFLLAGGALIIARRRNKGAHI